MSVQPIEVLPVCLSDCSVTDDVDYWVSKITVSWQKSVKTILETGSHLIEARRTLGHGHFATAVERLPFNQRAAQMLMAIAGRSELADANHGALLPASWRTLYELSRLSRGELRIGFENDLISPKTQRKDVPMIRHCARKLLHRRTREPEPPSKAQPSFWTLARRDLDSEKSAKLAAMSESGKQRVISAMIAAIEAE